MPKDISPFRALRILVIGAGPTTNLLHLPVLAALRDSGKLMFAHICDINSDRARDAAQKFGFETHGSNAAEALARSDLDCVYVFGSAQMHHAYGRVALESGMHLFVEKPVAPSYAEACELATLAAEHGVVAAAGHNRRFYQAFAKIRKQGGQARWRYAEAVFHKAEFGKPVLFGARSWLSANGIHALDALVFMMQGLPDTISSLASDDGSFCALMRWRDGAQGVFQCNNNAGGRREAYAFHGLGETYAVENGVLSVEKQGQVARFPFPALNDGIAAEHEAFVQSINHGGGPAHAIAAIAPSLLLAELIEAGFSGPIHLPRAEAPKPAARISAGTLLIVNPDSLKQPLNALPARYDMVSIADVREGGIARPDIVGAVLGKGAPPIPDDVLALMPNLAIVGIMGLSLARHNPEALLARGVTLVNASHAYAESVAEFALGLAILGRRRAFISDATMAAGGWGVERPRSGLHRLIRGTASRIRPIARVAGLERRLTRAWQSTPWSSVPNSIQRDLKGASVGLIGWGFNARAFAERLLQAGARVHVYSEHAGKQDANGLDVAFVSLREALACDIVSLHRGLNAQTLHAIGEAELNQLRAGTVLINVARGALIEPAALLKRLRRGDFVACLDTFEQEPPPRSDPLRSLPNVFLTSHIAGGSSDMHAAAACEVVAKVTAFLEGCAVPQITPQRLRTMS
jgi:phosphoglycerate dehydrogenase-like enzyme/predicted dehydrogenase